MLKLVRRTAPRPVTTPATPAAKPPPPPFIAGRRLQAPKATTPLGHANTAAQVQAREEIEEKLKLIAKENETIDAAVARRDAVFAEIEDLMRKHRLSVVEGEDDTATMVESFTRQTRTIDPKKFRAKVVADDFWACVSINLAQAERILGEREINDMSDIVPSRSLGYSLKIKERKKSKKTKRG